MKYFSFPGRKIEVKKIKIERLRKNLKGEGICIDWGPELNADIWPFLFFQSKFCCRWAPLSCRALQSKVSWSNWLHLIFVPGMIVYKYCKYFTNCFLFFLLHSEWFDFSWKKNGNDFNQENKCQFWLEKSHSEFRSKSMKATKSKCF